jgi:hypothetical protein
VADVMPILRTSLGGETRAYRLFCCGPPERSVQDSSCEGASQTPHEPGTEAPLFQRGLRYTAWRVSTGCVCLITLTHRRSPESSTGSASSVLEAISIGSLRSNPRFRRVALVSLHLGDRVGASRLHGASHGFKAETGIAISDVDINRYPELVELVSGEDEVAAAAYAEGLGLSLDEVIEYARQVG